MSGGSCMLYITFWRALVVQIQMKNTFESMLAIATATQYTYYILWIYNYVYLVCGGNQQCGAWFYKSDQLHNFVCIIVLSSTEAA